MAVCLIIPLVCLTVIVCGVPQGENKFIAFWKDTIFTCSREQRPSQTRHDDATMDNHEMVDMTTEDATNASTIRDTMEVVEARGQWRVSVCRVLWFPIPSLMRTAGDVTVPTVPVAISEEEREEIVTEIGSVFEGETLNRPDELDILDP